MRVDRGTWCAGVQFVHASGRQFGQEWARKISRTGMNPDMPSSVLSLWRCRDIFPACLFPFLLKVQDVAFRRHFYPS